MRTGSARFTKLNLLQAIHNNVLKQEGEEALNKLSTEGEFREFILTAHPSADVGVELSLCCLHAERLKGGQDIPVTVIDEAQHEVFERTAIALDDLTPLKRNRTWHKSCREDQHHWKSQHRLPPRWGVQVCHVNGVGFYADIAEGNVQYGRNNFYKVYQFKTTPEKAQNDGRSTRSVRNGSSARGDKPQGRQ
ncbi:hypothetical protein GQ600_3095 [Phytophthora cactorum]|nr:hypothetical protein GQ600_3095 [Phytophthora cactorum]